MSGKIQVSEERSKCPHCRSFDCDSIECEKEFADMNKPKKYPKRHERILSFDILRDTDAWGKLFIRAFGIWKSAHEVDVIYQTNFPYRQRIKPGDWIPNSDGLINEAKKSILVDRVCQECPYSDSFPATIKLLIRCDPYWHLNHMTGTRKNPRRFVHYLCQECLINKLQEYCSEKIAELTESANREWSVQLSRG